MNYRDKIESVVSDIKLDKPVFEIEVGEHSLEAKSSRWKIALEETNMVNRYVNRYARRQYSLHDKKFYVDSSLIIDEVNRTVLGDIIIVFTNCSPYEKPRRTKAYKNFVKVVQENSKNIEFLDSIFNINEYYHNNTRTDTIQHSDNSVHRKNIYQLLCLMEKSYGKERPTSNK